MKLRLFIIALFVMFSFVNNAQADRFRTITSVVTHGAEDAARLAMKKATTEASERIAQQQLKSLTNGAEDMARAAANKAVKEASERAAQQQLRSLTNNADNAARAAANNAAKEASERAAQQQLKTLTKPKPPVAAPLKEAVVSKPLQPIFKNSVRNSEASIASSQAQKLNTPIVKEIKPPPSPINTGNNYLGKTKSANEYIKGISSNKTTSSGISVSEHSVQQKINRNISSSDELAAIKRPLSVKPVKVDNLGRPSQRYIGEKAEVAMNPETKKIVSVNPTSSKKAEKLLRQGKVE